MGKVKGRPLKKKGRHWFDGKDIKTVLAKIEECAALDASWKETIFYADITKDGYYRYLRQHPDFANRLELLRSKPILLARQTVIRKMVDNYGSAMDYLSRKLPEEFRDGIKIDQRTEHVLDAKTDKAVKGIVRLFADKAAKALPVYTPDDV